MPIPSVTERIALLGGAALLSGCWGPFLDSLDAEQLKGHEDAATSLRYYATETRMATVGWDGVFLWDLESKEVLHRFEGNAFAEPDPSQDFIATKGDDAVDIYTLTDPPELARSLSYADLNGFSASDGMWSADGEWFAASEGGGLRVWRSDGVVLWTDFSASRGGREAMAFSPDGLLLANGSNTLQIFDRQTGQEVASFGSDEEIEALAWRPDGEQIATIDLDGDILVWNVSGLDHPGEIRSVRGRGRLLQYSADGAELGWEHASGHVGVIDSSTGDTLRDFIRSDGQNQAYGATFNTALTVAAISYCAASVDREGLGSDCVAQRVAFVELQP